MLPVTAAGVTLISPGRKPDYVAASNDAALRYEQLQTEIGEGPCLAAYSTGAAVAVPDLSADDRFPTFGPAALRAGLAAVFTSCGCTSTRTSLGCGRERLCSRADGARFLRNVDAVLQNTKMDPAALILEMTEGILIEDAARAVTVLDDLKKLGVRLALDDFGTGYSSLNYLRRFPVDILKIDQGFVADLGTDPAGGAIIAAITTLAQALRLTVTAEGVETTDQRHLITGLGCEFSQGFLYSRPIPAPAVAALLGTTTQAPLHLPLKRLSVIGELGSAARARRGQPAHGD